jgi:surfactin family lipopeptide synthetase C
MKHGIEDIYGLSPLQEGMIFHSLYKPELSEYFEQISLTLNGALNVAIFEKAWQRVVDRNPPLRTSFHWEGLERAVQVVHRKVKVPLYLRDLRFQLPASQAEEIQAFLRSDRVRRFDITQAPLMRLALFRLAEASYQFIIAFHHAILDGWSLNLVLKEFAQFQEAFYRQLYVDLPLTRPYAQYIGWLQQRDRGSSEIYWRRLLASYKGSVRMPIDRALGREQQSDSGAGEHRFHLSRAKGVALQAFARQHGFTLNTLVQAAWSLLLNCYTGERDVAFGTVVSGRPPELEGVESMVGLFINTLPTRVDTSPNQHLLPWLRNLQGQQLESRQHEFNSLVQIHGWSEVPRDKPLFDTVLVFNNFPSYAPNHPNGSDDGRVLAFERLSDPLTLMVAPSGDLQFKLLYMTHRFEPRDIERMAGQFRVVLEAMVADSERRLGDLPLLSRAEREQILVEWNNTERNCGREINLVALFQQQVERTPESEAVADRYERLTYCELNRRANRLAHCLQRLETGPEAVVCLYLERSVEAVVAMLGILKAGAAYLPLDPSYPPERLAWMVTDAGSRVVVTNVCMRDSLPVSGMQIVCVDQVPEQSETNPDIAHCAASAAYVIYTSGSTGWPKGIVGLHGATVNRLEWMWREFPYDADSVGCQKTALSFVDSVWEVFGGLLQGVRTVILAESEVKDGEEFLKRLAQEQVTRVVMVPSLLRVLLEMKKDLDSALPRLREWFVSGEKLGGELWERFQKQVPGGRLINLYGSSEVAGDATWYELQAGSGVAIGRPIANTRAYVLDEQLRPLPVGIPGDLYVGGAALARGYLGRPDLTAERFLPNPHAVQPGERIYWTGDLVRWRADGALEYLGRRDQQVKIRGFRIELEEIETELKKHPEVKDSVVVAQLEGDSGVRLLAYVVPERPGQPPAKLELYLRKTLPHYMIPSSVVFLDQLPLTSNGKIDRRSLVSVERTNPKAPGVYNAPRTPIELSLTRIWSELLSRSRVGIDDDFFELGGHSLLAIRVMTRMRETFQVSLPLTTIFEEPTIAGLAHAIEEMKDRVAVLEPRITKEGRDAYRLRL